MKKSLSALFGLAIVLGATAQDANQTSLKEGKIIYQEQQKLEIKLEGEAEQFADLLPKERKSKMVLYYNETASLYENLKEEETAEDMAMSSGAMVQMKMMQPENKTFTDLKKKRQVAQKEFMTRVFLISSDIETDGWKISPEQKTVLDYTCQKASRENEKGETTVAWFCPQIPVTSGPGSFTGLPGMVLEVEMQEGDHTITAVELVSEKPDSDHLKQPKKGKKVSQEEYDQIVAEKMEEMGAEGGQGNGTFMIRINR